MLVKFTIDGGSTPITQQARPEILEDRLRILRAFDPSAETRARQTIRSYLDTHTQFTAAHIACTGEADQWHPEFEALYDALLAASGDPQQAHEEAAKFLGLLVWNEALRHPEPWHFTSYPKLDSDFMVTHYFSLDTHIRTSAKRNQAATARSHGDHERADDLEEAARGLMARWGKS